MCARLQGVLCRTLQGHGHWVNTMALSTGYALRTGAYDPSDTSLGYMGVQGLSCECSQSTGGGGGLTACNLQRLDAVGHDKRGS